MDLLLCVCRAECVTVVGLLTPQSEHLLGAGAQDPEMVSQRQTGKLIPARQAPFPGYASPLPTQGVQDGRPHQFSLLHFNEARRGCPAGSRSARRAANCSCTHCQARVSSSRGARTATFPLTPPLSSHLPPPLAGRRQDCAPERTCPVLPGCAGSAVPARGGPSEGAARAGW